MLSQICYHCVRNVITEGKYGAYSNSIDRRTGKGIKKLHYPGIYLLQRS